MSPSLLNYRSGESLIAILKKILINMAGPETPFSNDNAINLAKKILQNQNAGGGGGGGLACDENPQPLGTAAPGVSPKFSRCDHVHGVLGAKITRSTDQSITDSALTNVSFNTVEFDTSSFFSVGSPTRLTIPIGLGGLYLAFGFITFDGQNPVVGNRILRIDLNGASQVANVIPGPGVNSPGLTAAIPLLLSSGDYVEINAYQSSGGNLNVRGGLNALSIIRV